METNDASPRSSDLKSPNSIAKGTKGDCKSPLLVLLLAAAATAHAGPRTSADYTIPADTTDSGGKRATSASYANDGSAGLVAGISTVASPSETAKTGYIGQLYDVTGLTLTAATLNVNEGATNQLAAWQVLDDATFLAVPAANVAWSVQSGPLTGISASGLATAGLVYQDTTATAQGSYLGNTGVLGLAVVNANLDNFGTYAGDGVGDDWQVQYFGLNNPNAGPNVDPTGGGQNNLFKYIAGLNPLDPNSRFLVNIAVVPSQSVQQRVMFSPRLSDRTYTVKYCTDLLTGTWQPLTTATQTDNGTQRIVTDTSATEGRKFYRIEITKP